MLEGLSLPEKQHSCVFGEKIKELSLEDKEILEKAFTDERWSSHALTKALNEKGLKVVETTLRKHRTGVCVCVK